MSALKSTFWILTALAFAGAITRVFAYTPDDAALGVIQKIFYIHLPLAISTFAACLLVFIASIGYMATRRAIWDDLAAASATIAVLLCTGVLATGMIWGKSAWGVWWTWSPRLTFSFMLWLLYVVYLVIRGAVESPQRRAIICAVYGIVAFLDVPLVYLSARLLPDIHPASITLAPSMKTTLIICFVPVVLMAAGLVVARTRLNTAARLRRQAIAEPDTFPVIMGGTT